jgi:hypothetical protein
MTYTINGVNGYDLIDNATTLGLLGTDNSLAYRVHEIERHFHSYERWYELAGTPDTEVHRADAAGVGGGYFEIDAGDSSVTPTWGAWVQILGSTDTALTYDLHRVDFEAAERNFPYVIQIAFGAAAADALAAGTYTEAVFVPASNVIDGGPVDVQSRRQAAGTKAWARCICPGQNTGYMRFRIGLHYYEG